MRNCSENDEGGMNSARNNEEMNSMKIVDETMGEVRRNWNVMTQDDYNPITVAMEMLQKSNSAHEFSKFEALQKNLETSMNIIIEKYYSGFNNAVSVFGGIVEKVNDSKGEVQKMKNELEAFRDQIQYKRTDLPELYSKIGAFKESVQANQKAAELSSNRIKYTELSNEKFFIPAAKLLMESYDILKRFKIESGDTYKLVLQEDKKHLIANIMDELLQHIFLKKGNSSTEWFSKTFREIPSLQEKLGKLPDEYSFTYMEISVDGEKDLVMAPAEFDFKPDSNSLLYVSSLLQALSTLGALEECLENMENRISSELFLIVEAEIKKSALKLKKSHKTRGEMNEKFVLVPTGMNNVSRDEFYLFCPILREMTSVIIAKLVVIVNIFKFIAERVKDLNQNVQNPLILAIQAAFREVKNFVTSIIYSSSSHSSSPSEVFSNPLSDISEILKNSKSKSTIDKSDLFKFSMNVNENYVSQIKSMAITVNEKERELSRKMASALNIDPYTSSKKDSGHKQIVKANIQYLQVLYNQFIVLFDILKEIEISSELTLTLTLTNHKNQGIMNQVETILEKEYIPFIENYMIHELVSAFKGSASSNWIDLSDSSDSFNSSIGKKSDSIISSYLTFVKLICECCKLIYYLPSHQESFERIMEQLCDQLLDKSEVKLRDLILVKSCGDDESSSNLLCFSVQFAKNAEIREILNQNGLLQGTSPNVQLNRLLSEKEAIVMERLKGDRSIGKNELLFDPKVLRELALLQRSFEQVKGLIFKGKYEKSCTEAHSDEGMTKIIEDESKNLHLHVYEDGRKSIFKFGSLFDAKFLIFSELIEKLGQTCLFTLHCEIRTHSFYFLDLAFREGSYKLDQIPVTVNEPDPYVLNWTGDLMNLADSFSDWFPLSKYLFLFDGLPILIDSILVNNFQYIKAINQEGCNKLSTNTTAIIQILTQLLPPTQVSLPKSTEYYRLAQIPCDQLVSEIQASSTPFTFLQYRALLDLAYRREALLQENNESSKKAYMNHLTMLKYMTTQQP